METSGEAWEVRHLTLEQLKDKQALMAAAEDQEVVAVARLPQPVEEEEESEEEELVPSKASAPKRDPSAAVDVNYRPNWKRWGSSLWFFSNDSDCDVRVTAYTDDRLPEVVKQEVEAHIKAGMDGIDAGARTAIEQQWHDRNTEWRDVEAHTHGVAFRFPERCKEVRVRVNKSKDSAVAWTEGARLQGGDELIIRNPKAQVAAVSAIAGQVTQ